VPAVKTIGNIAALLICFFLSVPHVALAQGPDEASALNQQVIQLYNQGRFSEALPLAQRALTIREKALGPNHPEVAVSVNSLADLYAVQGRYADAEPLYKRALAIREKTLGPDHPDVAVSLSRLAELYRAQGHYAAAEPLYQHTLAILEKAHGPDHPAVATALNSLADLYQDQGRYADAEPLYKRALAIREKILGPDHPQSQRLITPNQALEAGYTVLQRSASSAAGEAISQLAARFAAGTNGLAQLVRKDQDLTAEAERLDKSIVAALSKAPAERNQDQIRKRIDDIKFERNKLQDIFNQRFPDYVALSKPQPHRADAGAAF
jgi:tetratricopeptide (TPR) repeat protein